MKLMKNDHDNLKEAFNRLRAIGIYAKMNCGDSLEGTYKNLLEKVESDGAFFGFVGFSNAEKKVRHKQALIPLIWGVPDRMKAERNRIRQIIIDVLTKYGIIVDVNKKLNLHIEGANDAHIIVAESHKLFDTFKAQMEASMKSMVQRNDNPCGYQLHYSNEDGKKIYKRDEEFSSCSKDKFASTIKGMKRGSDFLKELKLVGRPLRSDDINDRDIEYLKMVNIGLIDVNVFLQLI